MRAWYVLPSPGLRQLILDVLEELPPDASPATAIARAHEVLGGERGIVAINVGMIVAELAIGALPPAEAPRWQLAGDPRLVFWRETYVAALAERVRQLPLGFDKELLIQASDCAAMLADLAVTAHLVRNEPTSLEHICEGTLALFSKRRYPGAP